MRRLYKLTDESMKTYGGLQWKLGEWHETSGSGDLRTNGWLHAYESPLVAACLHWVHAGFANPRLFLAEGDGQFASDAGRICGVTKLRLVEELELPRITPMQAARVALLCAERICCNVEWSKWVGDWCANKPGIRSKDADWDAAYAIAQKTKYAAAEHASDSAWHAALGHTNASLANAAWAVSSAVHYEKIGADFDLHSEILMAIEKERD